MGYSHLQAPYRWSRKGEIYTNLFYGLEIMKKEGWLRHLKDPTLGERLQMAWQHDYPLVPLIQRNLIEFHRFDERELLDANFVLGPVDNLKGKPYGRSLQDYARASVQSMGLSKIWVKKTEIELMELNRLPCARVRISYEALEEETLEGEIYFFIRGARGFNILYAAIPSVFDTYYDEALQMIQSFRFVEPPSKKKSE